MATPRDAKVRTTKDAQGNERQYNKQGQEKFKITEIKDEHVMTIAGRRQYATVVRHWKTATGPNAMSAAQKGAFKRNHKMTYDTGASMTTMSKSMLRKIGEDPKRTTNVTYTSTQGAIGPATQTKVLKDVVFYVLIHSSGQHVHTGPLPQEWVKIKVVCSRRLIDRMHGKGVPGREPSGRRERYAVVERHTAA